MDKTKEREAQFALSLTRLVETRLKWSGGGQKKRRKNEKGDIKVSRLYKPCCCSNGPQNIRSIHPRRKINVAE
jgi:hypothetical protein